MTEGETAPEWFRFTQPDGSVRYLTGQERREVERSADRYAESTLAEVTARRRLVFGCACVGGIPRPAGFRPGPCQCVMSWMGLELALSRCHLRPKGDGS